MRLYKLDLFCYVFYSLRPFDQTRRFFKLGKEPKYWSRAFGSVFRRLRVERGLTLGQVAERMGSDRNYVWDLQRGNREPYFDTVARLAIGLDIPLTDFVALMEKEHEKIRRQVTRAMKPAAKKKNSRPGTAPG